MSHLTESNTRASKLSGLRLFSHTVELISRRHNNWTIHSVVRLAAAEPELKRFVAFFVFIYGLEQILIE